MNPSSLISTEMGKCIEPWQRAQPIAIPFMRDARRRELHALTKPHLQSAPYLLTESAVRRTRRTRWRPSPINELKTWSLDSMLPRSVEPVQAMYR